MANKKILLINPNRYSAPPVIPVGIEYLDHSLRQHSFVTETLDLCFAENPASEIENKVSDFLPDAIGLSIRNIDSALYPDNEYFLPGIKQYIEQIKRITNAPVIIGGAALTADPQSILKFVGADIAVSGPGEKTLPLLLNSPDLLQKKGSVIKGALPDSFCPCRPSITEYERYINKGGVIGFETHKGCTSSCAYCIEAGTPVRFREPADIVCELKQLSEKGFNDFHLCDSEFNEELHYSTDVLNAIIKAKLTINWALYMKPGNYNKKLFPLLRQAGAYLVTLSADSFRKCPAYWTDIETMVSLGKKAGIKMVVDLIAGFPYETPEELKEVMDFFLRIEPDEVVINTWIRLYRHTKITKIISGDPNLKVFIHSGVEGNNLFLAPSFYNHVSTEKLGELICGENMFRIAGEDKKVNYQREFRVKKSVSSAEDKERHEN